MKQVSNENPIPECNHVFSIWARTRLAIGLSVSCKKCGNTFKVCDAYWSAVAMIGSIILSGVTIYALLSLNLVMWITLFLLLLGVIFGCTFFAPLDHEEGA